MATFDGLSHIAQTRANQPVNSASVKVGAYVSACGASIAGALITGYAPLIVLGCIAPPIAGCLSPFSPPAPPPYSVDSGSGEPVADGGIGADQGPAIAADGGRPAVIVDSGDGFDQGFSPVDGGQASDQGTSDVEDADSVDIGAATDLGTPAVPDIEDSGNIIEGNCSNLEDCLVDVFTGPPFLDRLEIRNNGKEIVTHVFFAGNMQEHSMATLNLETGEFTFRFLDVADDREPHTSMPGQEGYQHAVWGGMQFTVQAMIPYAEDNNLARLVSVLTCLKSITGRE